MFPPPGLTGGGGVPAQVLLGIVAQESAGYQASSHIIIGQTGNFEPSFQWYGNWVYDSSAQQWTYTDNVDWTKSDCGYGIAQVTTGMCMSGNPSCLMDQFTSDFPWMSGGDCSKGQVTLGGDPAPLTTYEPEVITALQAHLEAVYQAIHAAAPNAAIVVLNYPQLFPGSPGPSPAE